MMDNDSSEKTLAKENEKFVTVLTSSFAHEIAITQGRLETEGITCFVQDELIMQVASFFPTAIGGVKLQVIESDLNRAIDILKEMDSLSGKELQLSQESSHVNKHDSNQKILKRNEKMICPLCGSEEIGKTKKAGWFYLITSLIFTLPTPFYRKIYYCIDCKQEFKRKRK